MKIILIYTAILPYGIELANALAKKHVVYFITNSRGDDVLDIENLPQLNGFLKSQLKNNIELILLPYRRLSDPRGWNQLLKILFEIFKIKPDVIHLSQTADPRVCLALFLLNKRFPIVLTIHDVIWQHGEKPKIIHLLRDFPIKISNKIIVHGEKLKKLLLIKEPSINSEHVLVVPHGPYDFYKQWINNSIKEENNIILFFGRMLPYKGLTTLEKVAEILEFSSPSAKIIIAGTGTELNKKYHTLAKRANIIIINRFINNSEVAKLFQQATIVALPYEEASQSGVAAIAISFNKPIVATDVGALSELIIDGKTGFIVPPEQPEVFAKKLKILLDDFELIHNMKENIEKLNKKISWETISRNSTKIYKSCCHE